MGRIDEFDAGLPKFVQCPEGRCPELMQLDEDAGVYRCQREIGYKGNQGEVYTSNCYFHDNPKDALESAYWHRKKASFERSTAI